MRSSALILLGTHVALGGCSLLLSTSGFDDNANVADGASNPTHLQEMDAEVDVPHVAEEVSDAEVERSPVSVTQPDAGSVWSENGHRYQVVTYSSWITWTEARADAVAAGGYLATITSVGEFEFVKALVNERFDNADGPAWIGAYQPNPDRQTEPSGGWEWVTGEAWSFTRWGPNSPNNSNGNEHYAHISTVDGRWNDNQLNGGKKIVDAVFEFED